MIEQQIFSGVASIVTTLVGVLVAFLVAFVKSHFSARQIATASWIATDAVNFAAQAAKRLGINQDSVKYDSALTKAKELASKAGLNLSDSQWETLIESAYKKVKDGVQPLQEIASTTTPFTKDDIISLIRSQLFEQKTAEPQNDTIAPVVVDDISVAPNALVNTPSPKPITDSIQQTIDQLGEEAKAQAVSNFTQKLAAVVQEATQPVQSIPDMVQPSV